MLKKNKRVLVLLCTRLFNKIVICTILVLFCTRRFVSFDNLLEMVTIAQASQDVKELLDATELKGAVLYNDTKLPPAMFLNTSTEYSLVVDEKKWAEEKVRVVERICTDITIDIDTATANGSLPYTRTYIWNIREFVHAGEATRWSLFVNHILSGPLSQDELSK